MDGLDDYEKILAWDTIWDPSLSGLAIISKNFTFVCANPRFCEILQVTPQELLDNSFVDITPEPYKSEDLKNAKLVAENRIKYYSMDKEYELKCGRRIKVLLLVQGVFDEHKKFLFYASSIMEKQELTVLDYPELSQTSSGMLSTLEKVIDLKKVLTILGTGIATLIVTWLTGFLKFSKLIF